MSRENMFTDLAVTFEKMFGINETLFSSAFANLQVTVANTSEVILPEGNLSQRLNTLITDMTSQFGFFGYRIFQDIECLKYKVNNQKACSAIFTGGFANSKVASLGVVSEPRPGLSALFLYSADFNSFEKPS
jgi:hypothetical protein